jgi:diamine N-acetyltransferase
VLKSESIHIRIGVESDAPALATFAARTFEDTFGPQNRPEDLRAHLSKAFGIAQQTQELLNPDMVTLLGFDDATLVAFAQVKRQGPPPGIDVDAPVELHRFYVDRSAHGKGVAQQLMCAVHAAARDFGGDTLWLGVWERNTTPAPSPSIKKSASSTAAAMISSWGRIDKPTACSSHRSRDCRICLIDGKTRSLDGATRFAGIDRATRRTAMQ